MAHNGVTEQVMRPARISRNGETRTGREGSYSVCCFRSASKNSAAPETIPFARSRSRWQACPTESNLSDVALPGVVLCRGVYPFANDSGRRRRRRMRRPPRNTTERPPQRITRRRVMSPYSPHWTVAPRRCDRPSRTILLLDARRYQGSYEPFRTANPD